MGPTRRILWPYQLPAAQHSLTLTMMTVFTPAGKVAGFILNRDRYFEAFTADERPAGAFETTHRAATHLRELAEPACPPDGEEARCFLARFARRWHSHRSALDRRRA
jgi:hypothetical protein